jgi:hypothetical protein
MREIEYDVEDKLRRRMGADYRYDPFKMRLGYLSKAEQAEVHAELRQLLGVEHLLSVKNLGPAMIKKYTERSPAGRYQMAPEAIASDIRAAYLSQSTLRWFKFGGDTPADNYQLANTLPRVDNLLRNQDLLANYISGHGKTLIFDVETPSLNPAEGIWQLAAQVMDEDGTLSKVADFRFDNPIMRRGMVRSRTGEAVRLDKFLNGNKSTDFEKNMMAFFKMANAPEVTHIAGHNVLFDYERMVHAITKEKVYNTNQAFKEQADLFFAKFADPVTKEIGNVIDTNVLARMVLPHLGVASDIANGPQPYAFSLQNLLLNTDLSTRFSRKELERAVSRGLHYADVDVPFESKLLQALREHLRGERQIQVGEHFLTGELRNKIAKSVPMGPNIEMVDQDYYTDGMWDRAGSMSPMELMSVESRNMTLRSKVLPASTEYDLVSRISSQDRVIGMKSGRKLLSQDYQYLNSAADIPLPAEWYNFQKDLAERGVPLPGLSLFERHIASVMSTISGPEMDEREMLMRKYLGSDVLGLGKFVGAEEAKVVGDSRIGVVPLRYLKGWESEMRAGGHDQLATNFLEGNQMLGLSPFQWRPNEEATPIKEIGLSVDLSGEQRDSLLEYLSRHADFQSEEGESLLGRLAQAFAGNSGTYGVQIGTLGGVRGHHQDVSRLYDVLRSYRGVGADKSDQTPMFQTAYAGTGIDVGVGGEESVYSAGAFLRGDLLTQEEHHALIPQITQMVRGYKDVVSPERSAPMIERLKGAKQDPRSQEQVMKWIATQQKLFKAAPYAALGTVVAAGGYYAYKRHEKNKRIDETFDPMPAEPPGFSRQNYYQAVPYNPKRDPHSYLNTANVVGNLDSNAIGHTNMNQQTKYSYLFNGGGFTS